MSKIEEIIRIAARGDGVTASGRHVALAAPGDSVLADGSLRHGPHHAAPPCAHFGRCGGCQLQHLDEETLAGFVADRVANVAAGQALNPGKLAQPHISPAGSRRRASLHAATAGGQIAVGYREQGAHRIVDLSQCPVLVPELAALIAPLRKLLARQGGRIAAEIELTLADQGADCAIKGLSVDGLQATEALLAFAQEHGLARLTLDQGFGTETMWEPEPVTITISGLPVSLPPGAFLQATTDGEAALIAAAREWLGDSPTIVDLFAGLGTFAFALAGPNTKVLAVEAAQDVHLACKAAAGRSGRQVHALHRDLFRNPLQADELGRSAAVLLDPPRAGAREQVGRLAESTVPRIVYISCNPSSWARDAAALTAAGYVLKEVRPVGQFRWSTHVELASLFVR